MVRPVLRAAREDPGSFRAAAALRWLLLRLAMVRQNFPIIALIATLVAATSIASTTFSGLSHQFMSATGQPIEHLYWQLSQIQLEYERAHRMAFQALARPEPMRQAAALQRYEVFASRLPLVLQGSGMERIGLYPDTLGYIHRIDALIGEIDRAAAAAAGPAAKLAVVAERLDGANALMLDYAVAAKNTLNAEEDLHIRIEHTLQGRLMGLFYGVVAVVAAFSLLAWLQLRRAVRTRKRLVDLSEMLAEEKGAALAAGQAKTDFLANMSHELRTPLNAIIGFGELMAGEAFGRITPARYADYARDILTSGQHMLTLVGDLLDVANIETDRLRLAPAMLNLRGECIRAVRECDADARLRGVDIDLAEVPLGICLEADPRALRHMLGVVLSNALAFLHDGGRLSIRVREDGSNLRLEVSDTGVGMSHKLIARLMAPLAQAPEKSIEGGQGRVLGLYLVRRFMEMHGGSVAIESAEGAGATVSLLFPAALVHRTAALAPPVNARAVGVRRPAGDVQSFPH